MLRTIIVVSVFFSAMNASATDKKVKPAAADHQAASGQTLVFENKMVDGKKTWLPAISSVDIAEKVTIKLVNTLPEPHGFEIAGITRVEVKGNETKEVVLAGLKKGQTYDIKCHLHPAHVGAKLAVK